MKKTLTTYLTFGVLFLLSSFTHAATISGTDGTCDKTDVTVNSFGASSCAGAFTLLSGGTEDASLINVMFDVNAPAPEWSLAGEKEIKDPTTNIWTYVIPDDKAISSPFVIVLKAADKISAYLFKNLADLKDNVTGEFLISFKITNPNGKEITPDLSHISIYTTDSYIPPGTNIFGNPVPLPAALWLFGPALLGFLGFRRKTKS